MIALVSMLPRFFALNITNKFVRAVITICALLCVLPCPAQQRQNDFSALVDLAWTAIEKQHVDSTTKKSIWQQARQAANSRSYSTQQEAYSAIRLMLTRLDDPATRLLTATQTTAFLQDVNGEEQSGVGLPELLSIDIDVRSRKLTVVTPIRDTPAARAGLRPGDVLSAIDGVTTKGMALEDAAMRLRGAAGTRVVLTVQRQRGKFRVILERETIQPLKPAVLALVKTIGHRKIGYIALYQFTANSAQEMRDAIDDLSRQRVDSFVLDLRNNPGGNLSAARQIAGLFLVAQPIDDVVRRNGMDQQMSEGSKVTDKPVVVLVNQGTASAAELLASGLRSNRRAKVVGARTFGKGLIHSLERLPDGSSLVITIGRMRTLEGRDILGNGILPDVFVKQTPTQYRAQAPSLEDRQFRRAILLLFRAII